MKIFSQGFFATKQDWVHGRPLEKPTDGVPVKICPWKSLHRPHKHRVPHGIFFLQMACFSLEKIKTYTSWWFQPTLKNISENGSSSPGRGENNTYLKPPSSYYACALIDSLKPGSFHDPKMWYQNVWVTTNLVNLIRKLTQTNPCDGRYISLNENHTNQSFMDR